MQVAVLSEALIKEEAWGVGGSGSWTLAYAWGKGCGPQSLSQRALGMMSLIRFY